MNLAKNKKILRIILLIKKFRELKKKSKQIIFLTKNQLKLIKIYFKKNNNRNQSNLS